MTATVLRQRWASFSASKLGRLVMKGARVLFLMGILGLLAYTLKDIDWRELWTELPTNPLFYLLFLILYFWLPIAEVLLYRITWSFEAWRSFPAFIKKRIYNKDVLGYSGEVYFFTWARKHVGLSSLDIAKTIRDQNIVSTVASTLVAVVLIVVFLLLGEKTITDWVGQQSLSMLLGTAVVALVVIALAIKLRKYIFAMTLKTALLIFSIHVVRLVIGQGLQIGMWAVAIPEIPVQVWFTYAALSLIISRIPLIPNRDLLFLSISISLAAEMAISVEAIAATMLMIVGLGKTLALLFFAVLSLTTRHAPLAKPDGNEEMLLEPEDLVSEPEEVG